VLRAAIDLAPPTMTLATFDGLPGLPFFNPDLDSADIPAAAAAWRDRVHSADGLLICSPEYAHGVPGVLKNALDWLVGDPRFDGTPVAVVNASALSSHAHSQLLEIFRTMSARLAPPEGVVLPFLGRKVSYEDIMATPQWSDAVRGALTALAEATA